ncbi:hypothetical protein Sjap_003472 [Stephania japonica]|uniref:Receptor-like serine/threonine-protein kinase n=1 Tax=Stephania japonica TaxID=461633 RepID=A0AAP0PTM1_9MAGN
MEGAPVLLVFAFVSLQQLLCICSANSRLTLTLTQPLLPNQTLLSPAKIFEFGFFTPANSNRWYLGIWLQKSPTKSIVWVANRNSPLRNSSSAVLNINNNGDLILLNQTNQVIWSSPNDGTPGRTQNPIVRLLDNGNLIVVSSEDPKRFIWQSYDYPTDSLLVGMKMGWDLRSGLNRKLTSWKSSDDPSMGDFVYEMNPAHRLPELIFRNGSVKLFRSGPWNGVQYSGTPDVKSNAMYKFIFVDQGKDLYGEAMSNDDSVVSRLFLSPSGLLLRQTWNDKILDWVLAFNLVKDICDRYGLCGVYGICNIDEPFVCKCIEGFEQKSADDWNRADWSGGCRRRTALDCNNRDGFQRFSSVKVPDTAFSWVDKNMSLGECQIKCLKNCSCTAYSNTDIRGSGSGCVLWFGDLIDIRELSEGAGQDLYVRLAASELGAQVVQHGGSGKKKRPVAVLASIIVVVGTLLVILTVWCFIKRTKWRKKDQARSKLLSWRKRLDIINGVALGLLYLHRDSRLRIIHRDLKAANVLLDNEMNPKISDFGLARIFGGDETEANTRRVVGTYGYMSPEYVAHGLFSMKSDIFSFGVLILEIVSGKQNKGFYYRGGDFNLLGHAWNLWNEDKTLELVDGVMVMEDELSRCEVLRCIQVGLLCVQQRPDDRPTMPSVVMMLGSDTTNLPQPKHPGFYYDRSCTDEGPSSSENFSYGNKVSFTQLEGR